MTDVINAPWSIEGAATWTLDTDGGNSSYTIFNSLGRPVAIVGVDHTQEQDDVLEELTSLVVAAPNLLAACKLQRDAWDELFGHCVSNGVFNAWGKSFDCTKLNRAKSVLDAAIYEAETGV